MKNENIEFLNFFALILCSDFHICYKLRLYEIILYLQVFLEYVDVDGATKARAGLNGRKFGGNQVIAVFYPENKFAEGDYEG